MLYTTSMMSERLPHRTDGGKRKTKNTKKREKPRREKMIKNAHAH